jgi:cell division protein ZapA
MGEVKITINDRTFKLGCDDGEEKHLLVLADHLGKHVENLRKSIGKAGDEQLYLMAGLMVCDELWEARDLLIKTKEMLKKQPERDKTEAGSSQEDVKSEKVLVPKAAPARAPEVTSLPKAVPFEGSKAEPKATPAPVPAPVPATKPAPSPVSSPVSSPSPSVPAASPVASPVLKHQLNSDNEKT